MATQTQQARRVSVAQRLLAWAVHLLTASGVVWSLLALQATFESQWRQALGWLVVAVIVDSADGTLARLIGVRRVLPHFDGTLLDNLVDFTNYVITPALILHRADLMPPATSFWAACAMCLASAYQFCQQDAKTPDHYFTGFPSYWNVTALYLLAMDLGAATNLAIVVVLIVLVFVPIKYIYVTRTKEHRSLTLTLTAVWSALALVMLYQIPDVHPLLPWASLLFVGYYFGMSVYLTLAPRPHS